MIEREDETNWQSDEIPGYPNSTLFFFKNVFEQVGERGMATSCVSVDPPEAGVAFYERGLGDDRYCRNVLPADLSPSSLLSSTQGGSLVWSPTGQGGYKAGGAQAGGAETWLTLSHDQKYRLTITRGMNVLGLVEQTNGLFGLSKCELAKLYPIVEESARRGT